ncbi:ribosome maturation factor RimM [Thermosipho atlanticus]|uniref:Ribosome maturation factor RimM n=1 Tax=Thermosipho atlanticus DSM 15807 TaxID=1123380 RepID=A0A1M5SP31_9BACT|nr:ribosome maturation factor RimM [Thermosipho atlanticus]SHH40299.1 16S rRNA processing protein RimM [Thermosipho atlanticus DSM 15807]
MIKTLQELLKEKIAVGIIGKTHGLNGELKLHPLTNVPEIIESLTEILLYNERNKVFHMAKITDMRLGNGVYLIKIQGIETVEEAKKLSGSKIYIDKSELPEVKNDEYYFYEIINSIVLDENGNVLGKVDEIIQTGSNDVLVLNKDKENEMLIPVIKEYIRNLDKTNKKIIVKVPEWLE